LRKYAGLLIFDGPSRFRPICHDPVSKPSSGSGATDEVPVRVEAAQVRAERREELSEIIDRLYRRRSLQRLSTWDQLRYGPEVADYLRRRSRVYRRRSGDAGTEGPLPFALGFFRITSGGALDPVADALPDPQPELIVRLLSEFLEPGARLVFGEGESEIGWVVKGEDELRRLNVER
jgi:hypothetical protein